MRSEHIEVWLYGSRARGDSDHESDTDVLVVSGLDADVPDIVRRLEYPRVTVSRYSWPEIEAMWSYGSLFLCHVALEGHRLQGDSERSEHLPRLLASLPSYTRGMEDHRAFGDAVREGIASLEDGGWPDFECSVIATVARHAAILGAYCMGEPAFGREEPFRIVGRALGYPPGEVEDLIRPAVALQRRHTVKGNASAWLHRVEKFIDDMRFVISEYEQSLRSATA